MAKEPTLSELASLTNETAAINTINNNNDAIVDAFTNTLSRDGSTPNNMEADLDMDGNHILNVADPTLDTHLVTKGYADSNYGSQAVERAEDAADSAEADAITASSAAAVASAAADRAEDAPNRITTQSLTSAEISVGVKTFTVDANLLLTAGSYVTVSDNAAPSSNTMFGIITSYSGTTLAVNVTAITGSGTKADWTIMLSGARGVAGPTGPAGSGAGDMLAANNLSDLADAATARGNLGVAIGADVQAHDNFLDTLAGQDYVDTSDLGGDITAAGKALLDDANAAAQRTTLGLGSAAVANLLDEDNMASNSATAVPSQQSVKAYVDNEIAAIPSGGAWELITSQTASTSSQLDFTSVITDTYDVYMFVANNLLMSAAAADLEFVTSTNNGSSYASSGYSYRTAAFTSNTNSAPTYTAAAAASSMTLASTIANTRRTFEVRMTDALNANAYTKFDGEGSFGTNDGLDREQFWATRGVQEAVNAVRIRPSTGTITSGTVYLYGLKKA